MGRSVGWMERKQTAADAISSIGNGTQWHGKCGEAGDDKNKYTPFLR